SNSGATMARLKGDHDARRMEIAEATCVVLLSMGLRQTTLGDIADELGVTTGVLQHYFRKKDELLLFTKNVFLDRTFERQRRAANEHVGVDRLVAMLTEALPLRKEATDAWRILAIFNGRAVGDAALERLQHERNALGWEVYDTEIRELQMAGVISSDLDPGLEALCMAALVEGIAAQMIMAPGHRPAEDLVRLVERHVEQVFGRTRAHV
ncbi:MAG: TetR/AcrR family transcriptional regulator, partial [Gemmatimonadota bacterium]